MTQHPGQVHLLPLVRRETLRVLASASSRTELQDELRRRAEVYFGGKVELQRLAVVEEERQVKVGPQGGVPATVIVYRGDAVFQQRDGRQEAPEA